MYNYEPCEFGISWCCASGRTTNVHGAAPLTEMSSPSPSESQECFHLGKTDHQVVWWHLPPQMEILDEITWMGLF